MSHSAANDIAVSEDDGTAGFVKSAEAVRMSVLDPLVPVKVESTSYPGIPACGKSRCFQALANAVFLSEKLTICLGIHP